MALTIGIPREVHTGERRVAATPETSEELQKLGFSVLLETDARIPAQAAAASASSCLCLPGILRVTDDQVLRVLPYPSTLYPRA